MLTIYHSLLEQKRLSYIDEQNVAIEQINTALLQILSYKKQNFIYKLFINKPSFKWFYLCGNVGQGKTMICNILLQSLPKKIKSKFIHCTELLSLLQNKNLQHLLFDLIIIDEFEILDIVASTVIKNFILTNQNIIFVFTSNKKPEDLYKNGLQRSSFLPLIDSINNNSLIINLNIGKDYRTNNNLYNIYDNINISISEVHNNFLSFINYKSVICSEIIVNNRIIKLENTFEKVLYVDFDFLCNTNIGVDEYRAICENFNNIFIGGFYEPNKDNTDIARRIILFIDVSYLHKNNLHIGFMFNFLNLNKFVNKLPEIARTISRLQEMLINENKIDI